MNEKSAKSLFDRPIIKATPLIILLSYSMLGISKYINQFFLGGGHDVEAEGFIVNQLVLGTSFFGAFLLLIRSNYSVWEMVGKNKLLFFFLLYSLTSCLWSPFPIVSLKRWLQFLGIVLVGMAVVSHSNGPKYTLKVLLCITGLSAVISLLGALIHHPDFVWPTGHWTGLYTHKNQLGTASVIGLSLWLPVLFIDWKEKNLKIAAITIVPILLILMVGSQSATALMISAIVISVFLLIKLPLPLPVKLFFSPVPIILIIIFFSNAMSQSPLEYGLSLLGRNASLSGRDEIWKEMIPFIEEHPILGIGYNAFWVGNIGESTLLLDNFYWDFNQAHNGYVDVLNELGFVGLFLFVLLLIQSLIRAWFICLNNQLEGFGFFAIILSLIINNFTETTFCRQAALGWFFFLIAIVANSRIHQKKEGYE